MAIIIKTPEEIEKMRELGRLAAEAVLAGRKGLGVLVHDGDAAGLQVGHGAGDQVLDRLDLVGRGRTAADPDGHGGGRSQPDPGRDA